jgi:hypothetical protein
VLSTSAVQYRRSVRFFSFDFEKQHIHHEATTPRLQVIGKYEVSGRVLHLPIRGSGNVSMTLGK